MYSSILILLLFDTRYNFLPKSCNFLSDRIDPGIGFNKCQITPVWHVYFFLILSFVHHKREKKKKEIYTGRTMQEE